MKKRIMWTGFAITAVALVLFSIVSTEFYYRASLRAAEGYLRAYMGAFDETRSIEELDGAYAEALSLRLDGARVTFLRPDGSFLADSEDEAQDSRADREEVRAAIEAGEGFAVRSSRTLGQDLVYYCRRFEGCLVRVAIPTSSLGGVYLRCLPSVAIFLVADAFVCLLLTYLTTGYMLRPMEKLAREAAQNRRVETDCSELKPIADLLNRMNEDVASRVKEIDAEKDLVVRAQQSKNEFIANITHEMNTPLTSIRGFAELLASGGLEGERAKKAADIILVQSERMSKLVSSVINYNEIDSEDLPLYEVNASSIVRETLETLAPAFRERKLVLLSEIEDGVVLESRHERVTEIFGNLIRNAIRYNREGGSVSVLLTAREFTVSDTGIGIAEEDLGRIFDRFYTVDKSHGGKNGGFGLGLSIVKKLCKKQGWGLSVRSKQGAGSAFTVRFTGEEGAQTDAKKEKHA